MQELAFIGKGAGGGKNKGAIHHDDRQPDGDDDSIGNELEPSAPKAPSLSPLVFKHLMR